MRPSMSLPSPLLSARLKVASARQLGVPGQQRQFAASLKKQVPQSRCELQWLCQVNWNASNHAEGSLVAHRDDHCIWPNILPVSANPHQICRLGMPWRGPQGDSYVILFPTTSR